MAEFPDDRDIIQSLLICLYLEGGQEYKLRTVDAYRIVANRLGVSEELRKVSREIHYGDGRSESAWSNKLQWARRKLKAQKKLDAEAGHGIWRLSEEGIREAERALASARPLPLGELIESEPIDSETENFVDETIQAPNYASRTIAVRRGQPAFRTKLLDLYGMCMLTKCSDFQVLEACHINPYSISNDNSAENGLLLRADIHTLFDLGLITIDDELTVRVSSELEDTRYQQLKGLTITPASRVNEETLRINLSRRK